jgi:hypothetical protein
LPAVVDPVAGFENAAPAERMRTAKSPPRPCPRRRASLEPGEAPLELPMSAILVIVIFLAVFAAFNRFEFGRFD